MEIAPNIHRVPAPAADFVGLYAPNVYLVAGEKAALIDAGSSDEAAIQSRLGYINHLSPLRLSYIVLTHAHPDHLGGARRIREETGAKILVHPGDAAEVSRRSIPVDDLVDEGGRLDIGGLSLNVVHTPGHSPGHICIYIRGEEGVLFTGDHVLGLGTSVVADLEQYMDSLYKLLSYDIELVCPGHGPLVREPRRKIRELIQHRQEREQQILSYLRLGEGTIAELVAEIYPELDQRLIWMAERQVLAHLIKLEREQRVIPLGGDEYRLS